MPFRPRSRAARRGSVLRPLGVDSLEPRLAPAVFNIANGDVAAFVAAINTANSNNQADAINLAAGGDYVFTARADGANGGSALPPIALDGSAGNSITINGNGATVRRSTDPLTLTFRFMKVGPASSFADVAASNVIVNGLTVRDFDARIRTDASTPTGGAFLVNRGSLRLTDCVLTNNAAAVGVVDVIGSGPTQTTLERCTIAENVCTGGNAAVSVSGGRLTITGSTIAANRGPVHAGVFFQSGISCTITDSVIRDHPGRGVEASGDVILRRTAVLNNVGAGVRTIGRLTIEDSTVSGNGAAGGPFEVGVSIIGSAGLGHSSGLTVTNSTIHGNRSGSAGGGLSINAGQDPNFRATITHSTITANHSADAGGGVYVTSNTAWPEVRIGHTVIAGNTVAGGTGPDVAGTFNSLGYNFLGDGSGATLGGTTVGNQVGTAAAPLDPKLGPLQDNGGPTVTRLPLAGSPLRDAGNPAFAPPPAADQRGTPRVQNGRIDLGAAEAPAPEVAVEYLGVAIADGDDTPRPFDGTDFGAVLLGGTAISRTFTVRNDGTAPLALGSIYIPAGFSLTEALATALQPGASDTFTLRLDAWAAGTKGGEVRFATNDADEDPYTFHVAGTVATIATPEAMVEFNGVAIADGDATPSTAEGTDFGSILRGAAPVSRTFTVRNLGSAALALGSIYIPAGFSLTEALPTALEPGASDTFTLRLDSWTGGTKGGEVRFATDDGDESPYNFAVTGIVRAPEVTVEFNGAAIADGDDTPSAVDGTDFGSVLLGGAPVSRTFTVRNDGTSTLTLGSIFIPAGFSLTDGLPTSLSPGASNTFTLRLDSWAVGAKGGEVRFATNDPDESPYNFTVAGIVIAPEVTLEFINGVAIADGDTTPSIADGTDFGGVVLGGPTVTRTFTVRNDGTATLALGSIYIPAGFSLTEGLATSLAPGASDTFTLRLDAHTLGPKGGEVRFATNDADESPYNFTVAGAVTAPEVTVEFNGVMIADGDATPSSADGTDFGSVLVGGTPVSRTFTVRNDGTAPLALGSIYIPEGFSLTEALATSLAPGASDTFTLRLDTWTAGTKGGEVRFATDDGDESPFNFTVAGVVTAVPEVTVEFNGVTVADGDDTPSAVDGTDFGSVVLGGSTVTRTFTVRNLGTATLTLGSIYIPDGFSLTEALSTTLAPGASDTFTLRLDSWTVGTKSGQVRFATNDTDEDPYDFSITGTVMLP